MPTQYYLYILYDPTFISKRYYVGFSNEPDRRLDEHINRKNENPFKDRWINKMVRRQIYPVPYIITSFPTEDLAGNAEIHLIAFCKNFGIKLANIAPGGNKPPRKAGQENGSAKLTQQQVNNIREQFLNNKVSCGKLANKYNVSITNICDIVSYKIWKDGIIITSELLNKTKQRIQEEKNKRYDELPEPWNKNKIMSDEYCLKNSISHAGLKQTDKTRHKRSIAMKGKIPKNIDLIHSPEVAKKRGLLLRGENNGFAKLTDAKVIDLRDKHASKIYSIKQLSELFGIKECSI